MCRTDRLKSYPLPQAVKLQYHQPEDAEGNMNDEATYDSAINTIRSPFRCDREKKNDVFSAIDHVHTCARLYEVRHGSKKAACRSRQEGSK